MQHRSGFMCSSFSLLFLSSHLFLLSRSLTGCIPSRKSLFLGLSMGCSPFKGCTCPTMGTPWTILGCASSTLVHLQLLWPCCSLWLSLFCFLCLSGIFCSLILDMFSQRCYKNDCWGLAVSCSVFCSCREFCLAKGDPSLVLTEATLQLPG